MDKECERIIFTCLEPCNFSNNKLGTTQDKALCLIDSPLNIQLFLYQTNRHEGYEFKLQSYSIATAQTCNLYHQEGRGREICCSASNYRFIFLCILTWSYFAVS